MVEHRLAKARVAGSSPVSRSRWLPSEPPVAFQKQLPDSSKDSSEKSLRRRRHGGNLGLLHAKRAGVVGKSQDAGLASIQPGGTMFKMARYPSGKGEVCKTFMRRFDSDPRLQSTQQLTSGLPRFSCRYAANKRITGK